MTVEWAQVAVFSSGLEADIARATLEAAGILVLVKSDRAGIFGLTFQGSAPGGVTLAVPEPDLERARDLLGP